MPCSMYQNLSASSSCLLFFFFSSRRRHTRYIGDWSSDVCSSDLYLRREFASETNVEVILDRRLGRDRRSAFDRIAPLGPMGETMDDRRTGERRIRDFVAAQLRSIGYAMLRIR